MRIFIPEGQGVMNYFEDKDFEDIINNPLKNIDHKKNSFKSSDSQEQVLSDLEKAKKLISSWKENVSDTDNEPMEKNIVTLDKKLEAIMSIIEHQNEIISLLEEELDILWKHLGCEKYEDMLPDESH